MKKDKKEKMEISKIILIVLFILVILEVIMVPLLVYAKIIKVLPVVFFLVLPTLLAIGILLLSRNSLVDFKRRQEKLKNKINEKVQ